MTECVGCGAQELIPSGLSRGDGSAILQCGACGLRQVPPPRSGVASLYGVGYFDRNAGGTVGIGYPSYDDSPWTETLWQPAFLRAVRPDVRLRVLDVGCATGRFLRYARAFGWEAVGLDISEAAVEIANTQGEFALAGELEYMGLPENRFDAIVCWDVLEHLTRFAGFLQECARVLKPDGVIFFSTPDCGSPQAQREGPAWIGYNTSYEHVAYFDRATLRRTLVSHLGGHVRMSRRSRGAYASLLGYWSRERAIDEDAIPCQSIDPLDTTVLSLSFDESDVASEEDERWLPLVRAWKALGVADWLTAYRELRLCPRHPYVTLLWTALQHGVGSAQRSAWSDPDRDGTSEALKARLYQVEQMVLAIVEERCAESWALPITDGKSMDDEGSTADGQQTGMGVAASEDKACSDPAGEDGASEPKPAQTEDAQKSRATAPLVSDPQTQELRTDLSVMGNALWVAKEDARAARAARDESIEVEEAKLQAQALVLAEWRTRAEALRGELDRIHGSKSWRLLSRFWAMRRRVRRLAGERLHTSPSSGEQFRAVLPAPVASQRLASGSQEEGSGLYDVLVFGVINWDFRFQRPQQLARTMVRAGHRVLYVAAELTSGNSVELRAVANGVTEVVLGGGSTGLTPYTGSIDKRLLSSLFEQMKWLRQRYSLGSAVVIVDLPFWWPVALELRRVFGWRVIYDCMDRHSGFGTNSVEMLKSEHALLTRADAVIVSSGPLLEDVARVRSGITEIVRNAGDIAYFRQAYSEDPADPASEVILGYYGAIAEWFDVDAVAKIARARPGWHLVLVGDVTNALAKSILGELPNVRFVGEVAYSRLVEYLRSFTVCLIPFVSVPLTLATNPVKLYEYMASGRPCVSSALPEVELFASQYTGCVECVQADDDWVERIEIAMQTDCQERRRARLQAALANDWAARGEALRGLVRDLHVSVSIVIVCYNNSQYTRQCLRSVDSWAWAYPGKIEVVVVDNASTDDTAPMVEAWAGDRAHARFLRNEENRGFASANNQAVAVAQGDVIVFLNNDAYLSPGAVDRLVFHLQEPGIGLVGPVTNEIGNEARISVDYERLDDMPAFALAYTNAHAGMVFDIPVCALYCAAIRRSLLVSVGGLDERFRVGMFEDDDLAMAVRQQGLRVVCAEDAFVHHVGRAAFAQMPDVEYQRLLEGNRRRWEEKWGIPWIPHRYRNASSNEQGA